LGRWLSFRSTVPQVFASYLAGDLEGDRSAGAARDCAGRGELGRLARQILAESGRGAPHKPQEVRRPGPGGQG